MNHEHTNMNMNVHVHVLNTCTGTGMMYTLCKNVFVIVDIDFRGLSLIVVCHFSSNSQHVYRIKINALSL